ncbi:MAG: pentapeptide repeat-containing protein [Acidobacteriota bacterium]
MADPEHLDRLKQAAEDDIEIWNAWRREMKLSVTPDLTGADLSGLSIGPMAYLWYADLSGAILRNSWLIGANLMFSKLVGAKLEGADLRQTLLAGADFTEANLSGARLDNAHMVRTNFSRATLSGSSVFGVAVWETKLEGTVQNDLRITIEDEPAITVDDLEMAQFMYLLLNNRKIRTVIDAVTAKVVLILGRFTPERKAVLDGLRQELRQRDYMPVLFDFEKPLSLDLTETITLLARMARFVIADLTEPSSIPQELQAIVPQIAVPVQPLLKGDLPYGMFPDYKKYHWVLRLHRYRSLDELLASLGTEVIAPAEAKRKELIEQKNAPVE